MFLDVSAEVLEQVLGITENFSEIRFLDFDEQVSTLVLHQIEGGLVEVQTVEEPQPGAWKIPQVLLVEVL
jgi:hypothetical protein